jgi:hypothetical protein
MSLRNTPKNPETLLASGLPTPDRYPSMGRHRTTAGGACLLLALFGLAGTAAAAKPLAAVPTLIFPVAGPTAYTDDFGQAFHAARRAARRSR